MSLWSRGKLRERVGELHRLGGPVHRSPSGSHPSTPTQPTESVEESGEVEGVPLRIGLDVSLSRVHDLRSPSLSPTTLSTPLSGRKVPLGRGEEETDQV